MPWNLYSAIARDAVRFVVDEHAERWLVAMDLGGDPASWTVTLHRTDGGVDELHPTTSALPDFPGSAGPPPVCGWLRGATPGYVAITTADGQRASLRAYDHQR